MERVKRIESLCGKLLNLIGRDTPDAPWTGNSDGEDVARDLYRLLGEQLGLAGEPATAGQEAVNHPKHYNVHPSGIECITIAEQFEGNVAAAIRYAWRAAHKHESPAEDLAKMSWYLRREVKRLNNMHGDRDRLVNFRIGLVVQADGNEGPLAILLRNLALDDHPGDGCSNALQEMGNAGIITYAQAFESTP